MNTTIAAISTAVSASGIGIIRISGRKPWTLYPAFTVPKGREKRKLKKCPPTPFIMVISMTGEEIVDEVLVMVMRAPKTFTGEDTVEIDCHGGVYAMNRVLETVLKNGAKIAGPGSLPREPS